MIRALVAVRDLSVVDGHIVEVELRAPVSIVPQTRLSTLEEPLDDWHSRIWLAPASADKPLK